MQFIGPSLTMRCNRRLKRTFKNQFGDFGVDHERARRTMREIPGRTLVENRSNQLGQPLEPLGLGGIWGRI